jgi:hypothetical protein
MVSQNRVFCSLHLQIAQASSCTDDGFSKSVFDDDDDGSFVRDGSPGISYQPTLHSSLLIPAILLLGLLVAAPLLDLQASCPTSGPTELLRLETTA